MLSINNEKSKRIIVDMLINIIGTGLPLFVLQIIIYPLVARMIDADLYGQMQSTLSIVYLVGGTLGGALSTTRLIKDYDYQSRSVRGDFNRVLLSSGIIVFLATIIILYFYLDRPPFSSLLLIITITMMNYVQNYLDVGFRLELNYRRIFICKVLTCVGYIAGFLIFYFTLVWQYLYIGSYLFTLIYSIKKTTLLKEPFVVTELLRDTVKTFSNLSIASALSKALTYVDKLYLYPVLGGEAVSIYFAANIFGKLILQVLEPITNVVLSYLSKAGKVSRSLWKLAAGLGALFCVGMYFICIVICRPILQWFYPQWAAQAAPLIPIATASLCISSFISIIYPFTLKTFDTNRQIIINGSSLIVYVVLVSYLSPRYWLQGCCVALLLSYIVKLIMIAVFVLIEYRSSRFRKARGN